MVEVARASKMEILAYMDNSDLESETGWASFATNVRLYTALERPPYIPTLSTAAELTANAKRAGFERIEAHCHPPLAIVIAVKPA